MKPIEDIVSLVVDYGCFLCLADMMGKRVKKSYYYSPIETEFRQIDKCVIGDGFPTFERLDEILSPDSMKEIDLFIFPDIGWGGLQKYLVSKGKLVWGSMGASDLELYRTRFISVLKEVGLPVVNSVTIRGLTPLSDHLKGVTNKWVKLNRYRANCETFHHQDYKHTERELERLSMEFGPLKEEITFVVQDAIDGTDDEPVLEGGYDGWCVDGQFPDFSFQGYEDKNELYLGSMLPYSQQPESVRFVNERMSGILASYGYKNFWATEIRSQSDNHYFIDATARMAGQTMEHLTESCTNLPEIILAGAAGELLVPKFNATHAAEATLHYKTSNSVEGWKTLRIPDEVERFFKPYYACYSDGLYQYPPKDSDEVGVLCGQGDSIQQSFESLMENFDMLKDEPVCAEIDGFTDLLTEIKQAEERGIKFTDKLIPEPESVLAEK